MRARATATCFTTSSRDVLSTHALFRITEPSWFIYSLTCVFPVGSKKPATIPCSRNLFATRRVSSVDLATFALSVKWSFKTQVPSACLVAVFVIAVTDACKPVRSSFSAARSSCVTPLRFFNRLLISSSRLSIVASAVLIAVVADCSCFFAVSNTAFVSVASAVVK